MAHSMKLHTQASSRSESVHRWPCARRGSVYLLVLIVTGVLTTIGLTSISLVARSRQVASLRQSVSDANTANMSAIELAAHRLSITPEWRTVYQSKQVVDNEQLGSALVSVSVDPADASVTSDVTLTAVAEASDAMQFVVASVRPTGVGFASLSTALHVAGNIQFENALVQADAPISANGNIVSIASEINAPVQAAGNITGSLYLDSQAQGVSPITSPDISVIESFAAVAVQIPYAALPSGRIEDTLMSPGSQPFTNEEHPDGIYAIDCGGANITIRNSRIVGTLVLIDVGGFSIIEDSVLIEPARADYPSLLVKGSITITLGSLALRESDAGENFNPAHTPFDGISDENIDDQYPSMIRGVVYVSDELVTRKRAAFSGAVFADSLDCRESLSIRHDHTLTDNPPIGFVDHYTYHLLPGTWTKAVR